MGQSIELTAADGHRLGGWLAEPDGAARGGIVVLQEIFGVNSHIRDVAARFAAEGYRALAPALFDRTVPGFECGYDAEDRNKAMALLGRVQIDQALLDIEAALARLRPTGPVAVVGFCFGGLMSWLSACRLKPDCAIGFYAGRIDQFKDEQPNCPVMLHFGQRDSHIPQSIVDAVQTAHKQVPIHLYDAEHGFFCDQRASYDAVSSRLAWQRSLDFLAAHLKQ